MTKEEFREPVSIPEREAAEVLKGLRKNLPGVGISVTGLIDRKGRRIIQVMADNPDESFDRVDKNYKAESDLTRVISAATRTIKTQFALQ
jgi:hypothetical protein